MKSLFRGECEKVQIIFSLVAYSLKRVLLFCCKKRSIFLNAWTLDKKNGGKIKVYHNLENSPGIFAV